MSSVTQGYPASHHLGRKTRESPVRPRGPPPTQPAQPPTALFFLLLNQVHPLSAFPGPSLVISHSISHSFLLARWYSDFSTRLPSHRYLPASPSGNLGPHETWYLSHVLTGPISVLDRASASQRAPKFVSVRDIEENWVQVFLFGALDLTWRQWMDRDDLTKASLVVASLLRLRKTYRETTVDHMPYYLLCRGPASSLY